MSAVETKCARGLRGAGLLGLWLLTAPARAQEADAGVPEVDASAAGPDASVALQVAPEDAATPDAGLAADAAPFVAPLPPALPPVPGEAPVPVDDPEQGNQLESVVVTAPPMATGW